MIQFRKNLFQKQTAAVMTLFILLTFFLSVIPVRANENADTRAIDVIFVIDGSGSMSENDPKRIAMAASQLFIDLCDYDKARAGYVVYSTDITTECGLTSLDDFSRSNLKSAIGNIQYPENGGTDISLGLTRAKDMLFETGLSDDRSPMIILLSDGKTEIESNPARKAVYDDELNETLKSLKEASIPVYTIALQGDKKEADEATMRRIADSTDSLTFTADSADELSEILSQIMAHRQRSKLETIKEIVADGTPQTIEVDIPNDNIYQANIIILSPNGVNDIKVYDPNDNNLVVAENDDSSKVMHSHSTSNDLIRLKNPLKGTWKITMTGTAGDNVSIHLISVYDIQFSLNADRNEATNGEKVRFYVSCRAVDGVSDADIFDGAEGTLTVTNTVTKEESESDFSWNGQALETSVRFTKAGTYKAVGRIIGKDSSFDRQTDEITVTITPFPLELTADTDDISALCFSPFLGIKFRNTVNISLADMFSWDPDAEIDADAVSGGWENYCEFEYDENDRIVTVSAIHGGNAVMDIQISDSFGQNDTLTVHVKIIPGWVPFAILLVLIGLIVGIILIIKKVRTPRIGGKLRLSLSLPSEIASMTPAEAEIDLGTLNKKGPVSLTDAIATNLSVSGLYMQALEGIAGFVQKIMLEAVNANGTALWIHIPAPEKGANVQFDNVPVDKKIKRSIRPGMPAVLTYTSFNGTYSITFQFGDNNWGGGSGGFGGDSGFGGGSGFGGDNGGFGGNGGGFGGNNGGFGGNNGGFGGNNGGFGGNSGGFGGDNGGFGGNNGGFGGNNGGFGGNNGGFGGNSGGFGGNSGGFGGNGGGFGGNNGGFGGNNGGFGGNNGGFGGNNGGFGGNNGGFGGNGGGNGFNAF